MATEQAKAVETAEQLYKPLPDDHDSIRLIRILPGTRNAKIECTLLHVQLSKTPKYEALSYMWGDDLKTKSIWVNHVDLEIRENLWHFLIRIRLSDQARDLFVDALCISQFNIIEKSQQVSIIGDIFQKASSVQVWLGETAEGSDSLLRSIAYTPEGEMALKLGRNGDSANASIFKALIALLNRNYWSRTWIIQEIILASEITLHCGNRHIAWSSLVDFCQHIIEECGLLNTSEVNSVKRRVWARAVQESTFQKLRRHRSLVRVAEDRPSLFKVAGHSPSLAETLQQFPLSNCFDPRDKIYALLSLYERGRRSRIETVILKPDYSIGTENLFFKTFEADITRSLDYFELLMNILGLKWVDLERYAAEVPQEVVSIRLKVSWLCPVSAVTKIELANHPIHKIATIVQTEKQYYEGLTLKALLPDDSVWEVPQTRIGMVLRSIDGSYIRVGAIFLRGKFSEDPTEDGLHDSISVLDKFDLTASSVLPIQETSQLSGPTLGLLLSVTIGEVKELMRHPTLEAEFGAGNASARFSQLR